MTVSRQNELASLISAITTWDRETAYYYQLTPRLQVAFDATLDEPLTLAHNNDAEDGEIEISPKQAANLASILAAYVATVGGDE